MSKNKRVRTAPSEVVKVDSFEPDYDSTCDNCGQTPTVTGIKGGTVLYRSGMCGVCTFGTAECLDPENW